MTEQPKRKWVELGKHTYSIDEECGALLVLCAGGYQRIKLEAVDDDFIDMLRKRLEIE